MLGAGAPTRSPHHPRDTRHREGLRGQRLLLRLLVLGLVWGLQPPSQGPVHIAREQRRGQTIAGQRLGQRARGPGSASRCARQDAGADKDSPVRAEARRGDSANHTSTQPGDNGGQLPSCCVAPPGPTWSPHLDCQLSR